MIDLDIQIISLLFSFLFGFTFSMLLISCKKILYNRFLFISLFGSLAIIFASFGFYFYFLQLIDNSFFHLYHLIMIIIGFFSFIKIVNLQKK